MAVKTMTPIELFESNSRFHETLAKWSNNRFILQSIKRVNQLRRLVEYQQASTNRKPRQTQAHEHLEILDALSKTILFVPPLFYKPTLMEPEKVKQLRLQAKSTNHI